MAEPAKDFETLDVNMDDEEEAKQDIQSSNSSDSDSDSDENAAADDEQQLQTLEKELADNPSNYNAHVKYIKSLRKFGDIEKMRKAREDMNALFPLTPSMWSEWAKDEASLTTGSGAYDAIVKLYERGVNEYLSVSLWCDYLKYVEEHDPAVQDFSPEGLSKMRNLYERSLTAAGLHVTEGKKIWEAYREFENNLITTHHEDNTERQEEQRPRIRSLYQRQLSIPHADSESTLAAYMNWESLQHQQKTSNSAELEVIPSVVASAYKKALEIYKARVYHEEQISKQDMSETKKLENYMTYLKFEQSSGDPSRVQILYERAVTDFPLSSDLWLDYTCYLEQTLKVPKIVIGAYSRATRNCPCIGKKWVQYLLSLDRSHASELATALNMISSGIRSRKNSHGTLGLVLSGGGGRNGDPKFVLFAGDGLLVCPYNKLTNCQKRNYTNQKTKVFKRKIGAIYSGDWKDHDTIEKYLRTYLFPISGPTLIDVEDILRKQKKKSNYEIAFGTFDNHGEPSLCTIRKDNKIVPRAKGPEGGQHVKYVVCGTGGDFALDILRKINCDQYMKLADAIIWMEKVFGYTALWDEEVGGDVYYRIITCEHGSPRVGPMKESEILPRLWGLHRRFLRSILKIDYDRLSDKEREEWENTEKQPLEHWMAKLQRKDELQNMENNPQDV